MRGDGDGWVVCAQGHRHWGRHGAAGLLLRHRDAGGAGWVLLQHRATWSHHGDTWGIPGGARDSGETWEQAALREVGEETGLAGEVIRVSGAFTDDHGGWCYTTVIAETDTLAAVRPVGWESTDIRWVPMAEVTTLPLHPGFAVTWPRLHMLAWPPTP